MSDLLDDLPPTANMPGISYKLIGAGILIGLGKWLVIVQ